LYSDTIQRQLEDVFSRDWNSNYTKSIWEYWFGFTVMAMEVFLKYSFTHPNQFIWDIWPNICHFVCLIISAGHLLLLYDWSFSRKPKVIAAFNGPIP
jgi:hypothetical protein